MPKIISKTKINSKKNLRKSKTQKGGLFNKKNPKIYSDIRYAKCITGFNNKQLQCDICKNNRYKMRTMQIGTRTKDFLFDTDMFDNSFKVFTCVSCGKVVFYSNRIIFNESKFNSNDKSRKSRKSSKSSKSSK